MSAEQMGDLQSSFKKPHVAMRFVGVVTKYNPEVVGAGIGIAIQSLIVRNPESLSLAVGITSALIALWIDVKRASLRRSGQDGNDFNPKEQSLKTPEGL